MSLILNGFEITWYMQEICMHALGARTEYGRLVAALASDNTRQTRAVWFHLTSFLAHSAMISKYLSPVSKNNVSEVRKKTLKGLLSVNDDSDVLPRDTRDNVEHFDERIDKWVGRTQDIVEMVLLNRASHDLIRVAEKRVKRLLILDEMVFISERKGGSQFELSLVPLHKEVERIGVEAEGWILKASPYTFIYPH